jgi:hypothetical protein
MVGLELGPAAVFPAEEEVGATPPVLAEVAVPVPLAVEVPFPPLFNTPPLGPPSGEVDVVAFLALRVKAPRVLPVLGALIAATMPDWQWLPTVCPQ